MKDKMTLEEMKKAREKLDNQIKQEEEKEQTRREQTVIKKIDSMTEEQKEWLLSMIDHDRTSCSDEHPVNGLYYDSYTEVDHCTGRWRCLKCMFRRVCLSKSPLTYISDISVGIHRT